MPENDRRLTPRRVVSAASAASAIGARKGWAYFSARVRQGWRRVQGAFVPNLQSALAAAVAFLVAEAWLGHSAPLFAPICTYLCLGFTRNRRPRRVLEMGGGATLGIWLGELVGHNLGFGWWQVLLILLVAPLVGRFIDRSELFTYQAALQSVTIVGLAAIALGGGTALGRWQDALIGTLVAVVFTVVVPGRITVRPRRYARNGLDELARTTQSLARGLRDGDDEALKDAISELVLVQEILDDGTTATTSALETAALSPRHRRARTELDELSRVYTLAERATTTLYVLARQARGVVAVTGPLPDLAGLVERAAGVLVYLSGSVGSFVPPKHARVRARELAAGLRPGADDDWRSAALVSLLRAYVVDILQLTGLSRQEARAALPGAGHTDPDDDLEPLPSDEPSAVWSWAETPRRG